MKTALTLMFALTTWPSQGAQVEFSESQCKVLRQMRVDTREICHRRYPNRHDKQQDTTTKSSRDAGAPNTPGGSGSVGPAGPAGPQGPSGPPGGNGSQGPSGPSGPPGQSGKSNSAPESPGHPGTGNNPGQGHGKGGKPK